MPRVADMDADIRIIIDYLRKHKIISGTGTEQVKKMGLTLKDKPMSDGAYHHRINRAIDQGLFIKLQEKRFGAFSLVLANSAQATKEVAAAAEQLELDIVGTTDLDAISSKMNGLFKEVKELREENAVLRTAIENAEVLYDTNDGWRHWRTKIKA